MRTRSKKNTAAAKAETLAAKLQPLLDLPARGSWNVEPDLKNRAINLRNTVTGYKHPVYYGTRTQRTMEEAEVLATALVAVLNIAKAKRI